MKDKSPRDSEAEGKNGPRPMDITVRFYDNYSRTWDGLKKSLEPVIQKQDEQDAAVNYGIGYVEDKRLTHGISQGATNNGIYGAIDLQCNQNTQEYVMVNKLGEILRFDWAGNAMPPIKPPPKKFTNFLHLKATSNYILWTPKKSGFYITKEDFSIVMDSVSVAPIGTIIYGDRKTDDGVEFFVISECTLIKYSYQPTNNVVSLQDVLKISDIEADGSVIEQYCFDKPQEDKKQWIYLSFKRHCTIIDVTGRIHGTKKNLHDDRITAIVATGTSETVVTGDEKGLLKMWGSRWSYITSIQPHSARITHLLEHPGGNATISISRDQKIFAWSFLTKDKLEQMSAPEIVERVAINHARKSFMTQGPRKLVIWRMDDLFVPHTVLSAPVRQMELTWHPSYPVRVVVITEDNAVRLLNPAQGTILTTALVGPNGSSQIMVHSATFLPQRRLFYLLVEGVNKPGALDILNYDGNMNPCKFRERETWKEEKWDAAITAVALYDFVPSIVIAETEMSFATKKKEDFKGKATFLIAGRRDGCVCKVDIKTGNMGYFVACHKGHVNSILVNHEMNQFISSGSEPSFRLWKISLNQDEEFVPLLDISWKFPIKHICIARELIGFALSHPESPAHKMVIFNNLVGERYDHRTHFAHPKPILSVDGSQELLMFCTASLDETIRIWSDKNDLVRVLCLNWVPQRAAFGTKQGDILVGIGNSLNLISAEKYLTVIYRNRVIRSGLDPGPTEEAVPLNSAKAGQDARMYTALEEQANAVKDLKDSKEKDKGKDGDKMKEIPVKTPKVDGLFKEPKDSQRAKDYELLRLRQEDLELIISGNHPLSKEIPDPSNMTKKEWDEYGKSVFGDDAADRKFFVSESRQAWLNKMKANESAMKDGIGNEKPV